MNSAAQPHSHTCGECGSPVDIYPLHTLDNIKENYSYVNWFMRFNDALDANMLNGALSRLFEIGDWKKLGGRLRRKVCSADSRGESICLRPPARWQA